MGVRGQHHAPAALPPGKTRYSLYRRLGGPQGRSGRVRKISPPTGIRSPDRPARSESLYRLSYSGRQKFMYLYLFYYTVSVAYRRMLAALQVTQPYCDLVPLKFTRLMNKAAEPIISSFSFGKCKHNRFIPMKIFHELFKVAKVSF